MFFTQWVRPEKVFEMNSGEIITEQAGYVPPAKQIQDLLDAGQRLSQARKDAYDFEDGEVPEDWFDPTRRPGFDLADASNLARSVGSRLSEQRQAAIEKLRSEGKTAAPANPESAAKPPVS